MTAAAGGGGDGDRESVMARRKSLTSGKTLGGDGAPAVGGIERADDGPERMLSVDVEAILVNGRMRDVDDAKVGGLVESISTIGLQCPVIVSPAAGRAGMYDLCAGAHRLAAAKRLGWGKVRAVVVDGGADERALIEIDENLVRRDLQVLDRAVLLLKRQEIYQRRHPAVKAGRPVDGAERDEAFHAAASRLTGRSESAVTRDLRIGRGLGDELVEALRGTPLADREGDLYAMAGRGDGEQADLVMVIRARGGRVRTLAEIDAAIRPDGGGGGAGEGPVPGPGKVVEAMAAAVRAWKRAERGEREELAKWMRGNALLEDLRGIVAWIDGGR